MRVAIFTEGYFPIVSGVVTHVQTLKKGLEAEGHQVLVVTSGPRAIRHYIKDGVLYCPAKPMKKIYGNGITNPLNRERMKILREFAPDIVHAQTEFTIGIFGLHCARVLKVPVVYTLHTMYDDYLFYLYPHWMEQPAMPITHAFFRRFACKANKIIGVSQKVAGFLHSNLKARCAVTVIPNTVDLSAFMQGALTQADILRTRRELGLADGDTALIFVGRIGKEKSIDVLVDWFTNGFKGSTAFKLFLIGDGPMVTPLREIIAKNSMENQIFMLGKIEHDDLPRYYHACDLFATASLSEMNSISLLEATASGLYAVQRLDQKNRDQIETGVNGEEVTTPQGFYEAVYKHHTLPPEEKALRSQRVSAYACRYGTKEFTQKVLAVYNDAMHHKSPPI